MTNQEEQQVVWRPSSLAEAWAEFEIDMREKDPERVGELKSCFYGGAMALLAVLAKASDSAPDGAKSEAVVQALNAAEHDTRAYFDVDEIPTGPVTLKVLEVEAATADELIAKVRELVPLEPEQEEQIRQMHAARAAQMAKKH